MENMDGILFRVDRRTGSGPNKKQLTEPLFLTSGPRDLLAIKPEVIDRSPAKIEMNRSMGDRRSAVSRRQSLFYEEVFHLHRALEDTLLQALCHCVRKSFRSPNATEVGGTK